VAFGRHHQAARHGRAAKAVKERKAEPKGPLSLLQMIAWQGGLKPDADLRAMGLSSKNRVLIPGVGHRSVIRGAGMTMDELAERMVEHGFIDAPDENRPGDTGLHNRIRDMIDAELRGKPVRPIHEQAEAETGACRRQRGRPRRGPPHRGAQHARRDRRAPGDDQGIRGQGPRQPRRLPDAHERPSADDAWERAVMATALDERRDDARANG
jgi:hypothetical protein